MTRVPRLAFLALIGASALPVQAATRAVPQAEDGTTARQELVRRLDSLARAHAGRDDVVGVSVGVVHRGDTLLLRGYGRADVEWDVDTPDAGDVVYEIGSITKQFTAASVLLLVEEGALDLDADLTAYLPDYDTQGRRIPVRRLLDHTSGIKGYTEMPVFGEIVTRDLPRDSLVVRFEAEPLEFEPGTALIYNNSAYFLLGLIIEEVSGTSYEDFVESRLFASLGMRRSAYCDEGAVVPRRAHGYDMGREGFRRAGYLDHVWPYAAGSLCSTVGDLLRWNEALHGGEVLAPESYRALTTPNPLVDGTLVRYAMGLGVDTRGDRPFIAHGGGINGFLSDAIRFPDDDLTVVVLQNNTGPRGPGGLREEIVEAILGPVPERPERAYAGDVSAFRGTFAGPARGQNLTLEVRTDPSGALRVGPPGQPDRVEALHHLDGTTWVRGNLRYTFVIRDGLVVALRVDSGGGHYVLRRTEPSPADGVGQ